MSGSARTTTDESARTSPTATPEREAGEARSRRAHAATSIQSHGFPHSDRARDGGTADERRDPALPRREDERADRAELAAAARVEVRCVDVDLDPVLAALELGGAELDVATAVVDLTADVTDRPAVDHERGGGFQRAAEPDLVDPAAGTSTVAANVPGPRGNGRRGRRLPPRRRVARPRERNDDGRRAPGGDQVARLRESQHRVAARHADRVEAVAERDPRRNPRFIVAVARPRSSDRPDPVVGRRRPALRRAHRSTSVL